jgi:type IV pilus assembly protein PilV
MIEILVSLLILAIGVMGIIALQFKGLKFSHDASVRSQITFLANDISDRMRINAANSNNYVSNYAAGTAHAACNALTASDAANDLNCWHDYVDAALPPGSTANITGPVGGLYTASLSWMDREGETHIVAYSFQP